MKKMCAFILAVLLCAATFADVSVKKLADGNIEVTFFYGNPRAQEVVIAGDFTDWQSGALPMTKGEKGWTFIKVVPPGTVMKYKFISDGNWTEDLNEPDKIDDGFGGHNGLVDVDVLVAAASGEASVVAARPTIKFGTWSMLGYQMLWGDGSKDNRGTLDSAGLNLKSYLKISGEALKNFPVYFEIALAEQDNFNNLYEKGKTSWGTGWTNLLVDTIFDPTYYYGGQAAAASYLGHLKIGFNTPYVNWTTGYKYAKLPPHTNVNWVTVDKEWEAGYSSIGGFNHFDFAPLFNKVLDGTGVEVNAVIAPNRTADRAGKQYGLYTYGNVRFTVGGFSQYFDVQYNGAFGTTFKEIFKFVMEEDFIFGYQGTFGPVTAKANVLFNLYGSSVSGPYKIKYSPPSSDVGAVDENPKKKIDNTAFNINASYSGDYIGATLGYRWRGAQASMMYVEDNNDDDHRNISDQLGYRNTQMIWGDVHGLLAYDSLTLGLRGDMTMILHKDADYWYDATTKFADKTALLFHFRPYFKLDFDALLAFPAVLDGYMQFDAMTKDMFVRSRAAHFIVADAGLRYTQTFENDAVKKLTATYAFDNLGSEYLFNTLSADITFKYDFIASFGIGLRTKSAKFDFASPFALYAGVQKKIKPMYAPTAYLQIMYGMDPYKSFGDGPAAYNYNSNSYTWYRDRSGRSDYDGKTAIRLGLMWDL